MFQSDVLMYKNPSSKQMGELFTVDIKLKVTNELERDILYFFIFFLKIIILFIQTFYLS